MTNAKQKPSTVSTITMRLLLRKRMICCVLIGCCLAVITWLTFQQGKTNGKGNTAERFFHAKILPDLETDHDSSHHDEGVVVRHDEEADEERQDWRRKGGAELKSGRGNVTSSKKKDSNEKDKTMKDVKKNDELMAAIAGLGMTKQDAEAWIRERIKNGYCNPPDREITGEEGKFRAGYELQSVYVVTRHGDRTPMTEFEKIPNSTWNPQWNCDLKEGAKKLKSTLLTEFVKKIAKEVYDRRGDFGDVARNFKSFPIGVGRVCQNSQLTPVGWLQHMKLGNFMKSVYEKTLVTNAEDLRNVSAFKSTINTRTQQSAFSFMYGFLPNVTLKDTTRIKTVTNVNFCPLDMCACPALQQLVKQKEKENSQLMHGNKNFEKVMKNIAQTLYGSDKTSVLPGINGVSEILATLACHSMSYPCGVRGCINPLRHSLYTKYIEETWLAQSLKEDGVYEKLGRMFIHPFLTDMTKQMYKSTQGSKKNRFVFNSGHDITIRPMSDALGLNGPAWPQYSARIVFELWKKSGSSSHFLRILGYGKDQTSNVRFCANNLNEEGLCPFRALLSFVETENMEYFYSQSYQEACSRTYHRK